MTPEIENGDVRVLGLLKLRSRRSSRLAYSSLRKRRYLERPIHKAAGVIPALGYIWLALSVSTGTASGDTLDVESAIFERMKQKGVFARIYQSETQHPLPAQSQAASVALHGLLESTEIRFPDPGQIPRNPELVDALFVPNCGSTELKGTKTLSGKVIEEVSQHWDHRVHIKTAVKMKWGSKLTEAVGFSGVDWTIEGGYQHDWGSKTKKREEKIQKDSIEATVPPGKIQLLELQTFNTTVRDIEFEADFKILGPVEVTFKIGPGLRWVPSSAAEASRKQFDIGLTRGVCRARHGQKRGYQLGTHQRPTCKYVYASKHYSPKKFDVLVSEGKNVAWTKKSARKPVHAFGTPNGDVLCRVKWRKHFIPGKSRNATGSCFYAWNGHETYSNSFDVLTWIPHDKKLTVRIEDFLSEDDRSFKIPGRFNGVTHSERSLGVAGEWSVKEVPKYCKRSRWAADQHEPAPLTKEEKLKLRNLLRKM